MNPVKLPREVAEALDDIKAHFGRFELHTMLCICDEKAIARESAAVIRDFTLFHNNAPILLKALVNGYEVEETPEEQIKALYHQFDGCVAYSIGWDTQQIIIKILNLLGHKIEGVND